MQIDIDFEVFKALTTLRQSESDSYNAVIRRLLNLSSSTGTIGLGAAVNALLRPSRLAGGLWLGNAHFPDGTRFRANYKGETYFAEVRDGKWIDQDGMQRSSPSEAASAITGNNVNGWRFWLVKMPEEPAWRKLDEFKS